MKNIGSQTKKRLKKYMEKNNKRQKNKENCDIITIKQIGTLTICSCQLLVNQSFYKQSIE